MSGLLLGLCYFRIMGYKELLTDPRWQKKRLEIFEIDNWKCRKCGDSKSTLHAHHLKYEKNKKPWEYENHQFMTLCEFCHKEIHGDDPVIFRKMTGEFGLKIKEDEQGLLLIGIQMRKYDSLIGEKLNITETKRLIDSLTKWVNSN